MSQNALHIWEMSVWSVELVSAPQESDPKKHFRTQWCSMIAFKTKLALLVSIRMIFICMQDFDRYKLIVLLYIIIVL